MNKGKKARLPALFIRDIRNAIVQIHRWLRRFFSDRESTRINANKEGPELPLKNKATRVVSSISASDNLRQFAVVPSVEAEPRWVIRGSVPVFRRFSAFNRQIRKLANKSAVWLTRTYSNNSFKIDSSTGGASERGLTARNSGEQK